MGTVAISKNLYNYGKEYIVPVWIVIVLFDLQFRLLGLVPISFLNPTGVSKKLRKGDRSHRVTSSDFP